jgi:4-hydroxy-tetrahydrodipicolinate synthase
MDTGFIHGVIPPIITPVDREERVDEPRLRKMVDHVIAGGVHGILSLGSTGEFFGLDFEEQRRAVRITLDQAAGRVPVGVYSRTSP